MRVDERAEKEGSLLWRIGKETGREGLEKEGRNVKGMEKEGELEMCQRE